MSAFLVLGTAQAQLETAPNFATYTDMGGVGLMQMPTARFAPDGEFAFSTSRATPYVRSALSMQPLPGMEAVLRYTTILNRLYGPESFSGDQSYKDKGIDVKFLLHEESASFPQVALGIRDVGGTGLFAGEYLVLSRRYYDLDWSLGLGWGSLGSRGQLTNPLGHLFKSFKTRQNDVGVGGQLTTQYFHGQSMSIFGGVSYQTPWPGLMLRLELDGNNYSKEPLGNVLETRSPFNAGLTYRHSDWLDFSLSFERGNTVAAQFVVHENFQTAVGLPKFDPPPEALKPRPLAEAIQAMNASRRDDALGHPELKLAMALGSRDFQVDAVEINGKKATVKVAQKTFRNSAKALGRAARVMANNLPPEVEELTYVTVERGLETRRVSIMRDDLERAVAYEGSPEEIAAHMRVEGPAPEAGRNEKVVEGRYPDANWRWSPAMKHQIGGPDNPYFYQVYVRADGELQLSRNLSTSASVTYNLLDNLAGLKLPSDSRLAHVRSDIKDYLKEGKTGLSSLEADYLTNLGRSWYGRASVGLFEEMFGGVSGELLFAPYGKRWAAGVELNRVRQRGYDQRFDFRDYEVTTGHLDLYYRLPFYQMTAQLSVGQYLAGDRGATMTVSREFASGAVIGGFATKTNVSAAQFGEGSFDKGFFISLPVDLLSLYSSRGNIGMGWRPTTRDGGQRLIKSKRLYSIISDSNQEKLLSDWSQILE